MHETVQLHFLTTCSKMWLFLLLALVMGVASESQAQDRYDEDLIDLAGRMNEVIKSAGKRQIAVIDYTDPSGRTSASGQEVAEDLRYYLLQNASGYTLLDRSALQRVVEEQKFSANPLVDDERAIELGKLLAADAIVFGTIRRDRRKAFLTTKLIDTQTGALIAMFRFETRMKKAAPRDRPQRPERSEEQKSNHGDLHDYIPVEYFLEAGTRYFQGHLVPQIGANIVFRTYDQEKARRGQGKHPAGQAWSFGVKYLGGFNDFNDSRIGLGYRQGVNSFDDSYSVIRNGVSGPVAGDVWVLDNYEEFFDYNFTSNQEFVRLAHVQLSNIRYQQFYADLWYKVYLTPYHMYTDATKPYMGIGIGLNALFFTANYTGKEVLFVRDEFGVDPTYTALETPINGSEFPFDGFKNNFFAYDWNLYFGFERRRFGMQCVLGLSNYLGGSPLLLPYLRHSYVNQREVQRKLEENGLYIYDHVEQEERSSGFSSAPENGLFQRFSGSLKLTWQIGY